MPSVPARIAGPHCRDLSARPPERRDIDPFGAPTLLARKFPGQPISQRAHGRNADALALEILDRLDAGALTNKQRKVHRSARHRGDTNCGRALRHEGHSGPGADADVDTVGGKRLVQFRTAAERRNFQFDIMLFEDAFFDTNIDRRERECRRDGLADPQLIGGTGGGCIYYRRQCERAGRVFDHTPIGDGHL